MCNTIVRAGHRWIGLGYLIEADDGTSPLCDDPDLPGDVLRVYVAGGRQIDLRGPAADEFRRSLNEVSPPPPTFAHAERVHPLPARRPTTGPRRRRKAK